MVIQFRHSRPFAVLSEFLHSYLPKKCKKKELSTLCNGVGKTSLANTLETFLKSPTTSPESWSWLSEHHPELLCTQVMQLYDGLSINNNEEELALEVGDHAQNVKLVTLKSAQSKDDTNNSQALPPTSAKPESKPEVPVDRVQLMVLPSLDTLRNNNQTNVQVKLVDLGGHTAMV